MLPKTMRFKYSTASLLLLVASRVAFAQEASPKLAGHRVTDANYEDLLLEKERRQLLQNRQKQREQAAINRVRLASLRDEIKKAYQLVDTLATEVDRWQKDVMPLLTNGLGKKIASDEKAVQAFLFLYEKERQGADLADLAKRQLTTLRVPVDAALIDGKLGYEPDAVFIAELAKLKSQLAAAIKGYRQDRGTIFALVKSKQQATSTTLEVAIKNLRARQASLLAEAIHKSEALALQKANQQVAAARAKAITIEKTLEAERIEREASDKKQRAELAAQRRLAEAEKARLVAACKSSEVRRYLRPFLAKGYYQPGDISSYRASQPGAPKPMSLSRLRGTGCLSDPRRLVINASSRYDRERRTSHWNFDYRGPGYWSEEQRKFVATAQDLLKKLGPTLVELEMLSP